MYYRIGLLQYAVVPFRASNSQMLLPGTLSCKDQALSVWVFPVHEKKRASQLMVSVCPPRSMSAQYQRFYQSWQDVGTLR
jgi:hypothetical protein